MVSAALSPEPMAFPALIGDVGGTNVRFALIADSHAGPRLFPPGPTAAYPDLAGAVEAMVLTRTSLTPRSAVLALAGPVRGETVHLTNAEWTIRPREVMAALGIGDLVLVNDFEALALALTALGPADLEPIGGGEAEAGAPKVVLGPGTGLGVAALVRAGHLWVPVPGEGGHVALGPAEADEYPVWQAMEPEHGRVSAEAVLSGRGLVRLYRAVAASRGAPAPLSEAEAVSAAGLSGEDAAAAATLALYCRLLGRLAGDLALVFMAMGGVFIAGGIAPRLLPVLRKGEFRRAFEAKAPHEALIARIPTSVIVAEQPAIAGLAAFARSPGRFAMALDGRRWRAPA